MKSKLKKFKIKKMVAICSLPTIFIAMGSMTYAACTAGTDVNGQTTYTCINETSQYTPINGYDHVIISTTANNSLTGPQGFGIYINGSIWNLNDLTITTTGSGSDAIRTNGGGGTVNIVGKLYIKTEGSSADGINASITTSGTINIGNGAEIYTKSGVAVRSNLANGANRTNLINIGDNAIISTEGSGSNSTDTLGYAVFSGNREWETVGVPQGSAKVTIAENSQISTAGNNAYAVYANREGVIQLGGTTITTTGNNAHGLVAEDGTVKYYQTLPLPSFVKDTKDFEGGRIYLTGDANIKVKDGNYAIYASGKNSVISSYNLDTNTNTSGKFNVTGDMKADNLGEIDLRMTNDSLFRGNTSINNGIINLSITGTDSQWHMSKSSALTHLNLQSDAQVYLGDQTAQLIPSNQVILTMKELSGSGIFNMRTNIADEFADLVKITGTANGVHGIMVSDKTTGGANVTGSEVTKLVEMMGGDAQFNLLNLNSQNINGIDIGAYVYQLSQVADVGGASNWVLSGSALPPTPPVVPPVTPPVVPPVTPPVVPPVTPPVEPPLTNTAKASISMLNINYLLAYAETQTLLQRMGELRDNESSGDVWSRVYGGKFNSFTAALESVDFNYSGFQLGLDQQIRNAYGNFYLGGMVGYSTGKAKYQVGKGDTRSYSMGIYGTYQNDDDLYIDGVLKYTNIRNQFNTYTSGGYKVFGKGTSSGLSASIELGKRFYFNDKKEGVYLEPQVQLVYSHQGTTTVRSSNQLNTHLSSVDSLLGRVSLVAGYNLQESENPMSIYFKTGFIKEFKGKAEYAFNQGEFKSYRMDGHWWENGVGVTAKFKKQHNLYLEASHASGRKFNKLQLNIGYRFEF